MSEDKNTVFLPSAQAISVKLPPFSIENLKGYFSILEAQFGIAGITSDVTMFFHALSGMSPEVVIKLPTDILEARSYIKLKENLVDFYTETKAELVEKFMQATPLQGRPSHFLTAMQIEASKVGISDDLVRHKFLQCLPITVAQILMPHEDMTLQNLAKLADQILPLSVSRGTDQGATSFAAHRGQFNSRQHTDIVKDSQFLGDFNSVKPFHKGQRPRICRAHIYYADFAKSCKVWCKYPSKSKDLQILPNSRASSPVGRTSGN